VRRVVTAVDGSGKSFVASDEEIADTGRLWSADPADIRGWLDDIDPEQVYEPAQPPPGGALWYLSELPPGKGMNPTRGSDPGFHVTRTTDFVYILSGSVLLDLDHGSVELSTGDAVVLRAGNHAWRNPTTEPARFLDLLMSHA
jgi:mannose-6-phosphate isomerase-like protein (cupin superfamily)